MRFACRWPLAAWQASKKAQARPAGWAGGQPPRWQGVAAASAQPLWQHAWLSKGKASVPLSASVLSGVQHESFC